ncbi:sigma 54-interacting transcriptional regulator [Geomonas oryzae]|uniref:sigma 54-interacting transcriptional regulator n=1 Tax=Geomonas oryzae TaxID=2364273 RepID=UPI00100B96A4|nr:sigma 54-interacting transcriptional regulator [Geomonas oryzae]
MTIRKIADQEWTFLETVARAAFANPFGEARDDLDILIGGASPGASPEEVLGAVLARVTAQVENLRARGVADLRGQEGSRREVLRRFFFFHVFHRYVDHFDRLIQAQLKQGDKPCRVDFAPEVLGEMAGFGLTGDEAERAFAVFYQLRRAFYFIRNGLVGSSPSMKALRRHLWDCVFTHDIRWFEAGLWSRMEEFSILLLGETGTGKGAAAAAIGRSGFIPYDPARNGFTESFTRNFVAINLSQYSEGVLESELFGHKKGAFTGAVDNHEGLFSRCAPHGVIFLDEIGDVSVPVQIKLLQVLQERVFYPVGSHEPRRFSGRIVAATNRPLDDLMLGGRFREDLYYRLCSDVVTIPPLRERLREDPDELDNLIGAILYRVAGQQVPARERQLVKKVIRRDVGGDYDWPGNVRELEQAVKRIILTGRYQGMKREKGAGMERLSVAMQDGSLGAEELLAAYCGHLYDVCGTYEEVARRTRLDRRTVKKYVQMGTEV